MASSAYKIVMNKYPEIAALAKKYNEIPHGFRSEIRDLIRQAKRQFAHSEHDELTEKLNRYGNKGRWGRDQLERLTRMIFDNNKVDFIDIGDAISVEIECIFPNKTYVDKFVSLVKAAGLKKQVCLKSDGSIQVSDNEDDDYCPDEDCDCGRQHSEESGRALGREIVVTYSKKNPNVLQQVCDFLTQCRTSVNTSCGLHVHFDMRDKNGYHVSKMAKRVGAVVPLLKLMLPKSRRNNRYCRQDISSRSDRYAFVNKTSFQKHSTLEIRGHSGTTDYVKINNWVKLLIQIMDSPTVKASTFFQMLADINCPNDLYDYCKERYFKFGSNEVEGLPMQIVSEGNSTEELEEEAA